MSGVLIPLRGAIRRAWPVAALTVTTGSIPNQPIGPGDTTIIGPGPTSFAVAPTGVGSLTVNGGNTLTISITDGGLLVGGSQASQLIGQGDVFIDGLGSRIDLTVPNTGTSVGRWGAASTGTLTITNGGVLTTSGLNVGVGDLGTGATDDDGVNGAAGTVVIDGAGSSLTISGLRSTGQAVGATIGRDGGTGSLTLGNGAAMSLNQAGAPTGTVGITIGRGFGTGTLTVETGATLDLDVAGVTQGGGITVGWLAGGQGTLNVLSGGTLTLRATPVGGGMTVGREGGTGTMIVDGAGTKVEFDGTTAGARPGLTLGAEAGSQGTVEIRNGAEVTFTRQTATTSCCVTIGRLGHGILRITSGGKLTIDDTTGFFDAAGSVGMTLGGDTATQTGGTFEALVSGPGSALTINATADGGMSIGRFAGSAGTMTVENGAAGGTINGNGGTIIGDVIADPACVISPGNSPGTLSIIGSLTVIGGKILLEVDAFGNHDILAVEGPVSIDASTQVEVRVDPTFHPDNGATLQMVQAQTTPQAPQQFLLTLTVPESGSPTVRARGDLAGLSQPVTVVPDVTIPPTFLAVQIDIKPDKFPNVVKKSKGAFPVAIISTPAFDALTVDPLSITLDGAHVTLAKKDDRPKCSADDVNGDGRADLVCHVETPQLEELADGYAILDAIAYPTGAPPGLAVRGVDFIRTKRR